TARQDLDEVRHLLQTGKYSPNTANEDGLTPMHQCSIDNSEKLLRLLIEYGADINARDRDLWTPLHAAVLLYCVTQIILNTDKQTKNKPLFTF
ncbi:unnamed protein product, partial [Rotaria sp. Silwood2]